MADPIIIDVQLSLLEDLEDQIKAQAGSNKDNPNSSAARNKRNLSLQTISAMGQKLLTSFGDDSLNQLSSGIGKVTQFATLSARAAGGDPMAIANLSIELISGLIQKIMTAINAAKQKSEELNRLDMARVDAGLLDLSEYEISKDWSGRNIYHEKEHKNANE